MSDAEATAEDDSDPLLATVANWFVDGMGGRGEILKHAGQTIGILFLGAAFGMVYLGRKVAGHPDVCGATAPLPNCVPAIGALTTQAAMAAAVAGALALLVTAIGASVMDSEVFA